MKTLTCTFELGDYVTFPTGPGLTREGKVISKQLHYGTVWLTIEHLLGTEPNLVILKEEQCNYA